MAKSIDSATRQLRAPYTLEDVYLVLRVLAFFGGNMRRTAKALRDAGHRISLKTIERSSQRQYPDVYADAQAEVHRETWQNSLSLAVQVVASKSELLGRLRKSFPLPNPEDPAA